MSERSHADSDCSRNNWPASAVSPAELDDRQDTSDTHSDVSHLFSGPVEDLDAGTHDSGCQCFICTPTDDNDALEFESAGSIAEGHAGLPDDVTEHEDFVDAWESNTIYNGVR